MRRFLLLLPCAFLFAASHAQTGRAMLKGSVMNTAGKPVYGVTISLLRAGDSTLVRYAISDTAGSYSLEVAAPGDYLVGATAVGFESRVSAPVHVLEGEGTKPVEILVLATAASTMKGVTVAARTRPPIEIRADRMVLNVANNINATGTNALELLRKSPGVRVDDDDILINGKNSIAVYIDGRPTNLSGRDLTTILANIQSSDIESIEVINNPSARLDAEGAGIINIRLKKNLNYGLNADVTLSYAQAHWPKANSALNINYRNKKMNLFGSYSYLDARYRTWSDFLRRQVSKGTLTTFDQHSINDQTNHTHNYKAGADLFLSRKSTLGLLFNGTSSNNPTAVSSNTAIYANPAHIDSVLVAPSDFHKRFGRASYNMNYQYQDTLGHTLNVDADYSTFNNNRYSYQPNTYYNAGGAKINEILFKISTATDVTVKSAKADYEQKFMGGQLGIGVKISQVKTGNDFRYFDVGTAYDTLNASRSNLFFYDERIRAAYFSYLRTVGKWTVQAGLRSEYTKARGDLVSGSVNHGQTVDTSYLNFFPSGSLTYHLEDRMSLGLSYSRRIGRPVYAELNPFETPLDVLTISKGNPFLHPQYTNNAVLSFIYRSFSSSLAYSRTSDYFSQVLDTLSDGRSIQTFRNIRQQVLSLNLVEQFAVRKWWYNFISVNAYNTKIYGPVNNGYLDLSANSLNVYADESFTLPRNWRIQLSGFYNAPSINGTVRNRSYWNLDLGVQKRFWDNNASLRLSVTDLFKTLRNRGVIDFEGLYINGHIHWESRQVNLTFSYRFGNKNVKNARVRKTSAEEEKSRVRD